MQVSNPGTRLRVRGQIDSLEQFSLLVQAGSEFLSKLIIFIEQELRHIPDLGQLDRLDRRILPQLLIKGLSG
jgi:hypothetical protein